ncbi:uncharacterized protein METZ01_LOCUS154323 [marine metagenome]|uniref:Guanylate cyclase domain-containing protein n=1 Tax=marine metagenome TaxID=408172 RepID=A0A382AJB7_9ZZZZ
MPSTIKRESSAVMFSDIADYTEIMASDEEEALSLLQNAKLSSKDVKFGYFFDNIIKSMKNN